MRVTPAIIQHEFMGVNAKVVKSSNTACVGIDGRVVNETRNTFMILHGNRRKVLSKNGNVFRFSLLDGTVVEIDGKILVGKPEDRIKKRVRRLW